jgi:hypothetical protein
MTTTRLPKGLTLGAWASPSSKTYEHASGVTVRYDHNRCTWQVLGGPADGRRYERLHVAAYVVERGLTG